MKVIKNEIRPVGYITLELSAVEIEVIVGVFQELCYVRNVPFEHMKGVSEDIYKTLLEALDKGRSN